MTDICDKADEYINQSLEIAMMNRVVYSGVSAEECIECGDEIPKARRDAVPGCNLCVSCAGYAETRSRM